MRIDATVVKQEYQVTTQMHVVQSSTFDEEAGKTEVFASSWSDKLQNEITIRDRSHWKLLMHITNRKRLNDEHRRWPIEWH